jgi:hypothetical protein
MNRLELISILSSTDEEEVYIELEDGTICDEIRIGHCDEVFDGFYTAFPAGITLKGIDNG